MANIEIDIAIGDIDPESIPVPGGARVFYPFRGGRTPSKAWQEIFVDLAKREVTKGRNALIGACQVDFETRGVKQGLAYTTSKQSALQLAEKLEELILQTNANAKARNEADVRTAEQHKLRQEASKKEAEEIVEILKNRKKNS